MKKCFKYIAALFSMVSFLGCNEELTDGILNNENGIESSISVSLNPVSMTGNLDAKALNTTEVSDITGAWIIIYDNNDNITGRTDWYSKKQLEQEIAVVLPPRDLTYTFVAVANTKDSKLPFAQKSTLEQLKRFYKPVKSLSDMYEAVNTSNDVIMSGVLKVKNIDGVLYEVSDADNPVEIASLDFKLYRSVAKLTVTVYNETGEGDSNAVDLKNIRICNVPNKLFYAEVLRDNADYSDSPVPGEADDVEYFSLPADECNLAKGSSEPLVFSYYMPRNCRGVDERSQYNYTKNQYADKYSTYLQLEAVRNDKTPVVYKFYLGENMTDDFNVIQNHHYKMTIRIQDAGSSSDSRVEVEAPIRLEEANSYIVNPMDRDFQRVRAIPVARRVNRFWAGKEGAISPPVGNDAGTEWVAEVIWQDVAGKRLIYFCDENGNIDTDDVYEGKGFEDLFFKPVDKDARGNVLIGVKKKGNDSYNQYLWSWHLWITDYNPDAAKDTWGGTYKYAVPGGEVHRYDDGDGYDVWSTIYSNKWIMDRNFGAKQSAFGSETAFADVLGLAYQWGRKDPFPFYSDYEAGEGGNVNTNNKTYLYDIKGNLIAGHGAFANVAADYYDYVEAIKEARTVTISESIQNPAVFYVSAGGSWKTNDGDVNVSLWNNLPQYISGITAETGMIYRKSLFDPCPPGWMVPEAGVTSVFEKPSSDASLYYNFRMTAGTNPPRVMYPFSGSRHDNGQRRNVGVFGFFWFSTPVSKQESTLGNSLVFQGNSLDNPRSHAQARAFPVRCIQEPEPESK